MGTRTLGALKIAQVLSELSHTGHANVALDGGTSEGEVMGRSVDQDSFRLELPWRCPLLGSAHYNKSPQGAPLMYNRIHMSHGHNSYDLLARLGAGPFL